MHCFAGVSRSAAITIAYFIFSHNMSVESAYELVRKQRSCISPNLNFMGQLSTYHSQLKKAFASHTVPRTLQSSLSDGGSSNSDSSDASSATTTVDTVLVV